MDDLRKPAGLLRELLRKNAHGVWFLTVDDSRYLPVPRWMWAYCEKACPNPKGADDGERR